MTTNHPPIPMIQPTFWAYPDNICEARGFSDSTVVVSANANAEAEITTMASNISHVTTFVSLPSTIVTGRGNQLRRAPLFNSKMDSSVSGSDRRPATRPSRESLNATLGSLPHGATSASLLAAPYNSAVSPPHSRVTPLAEGT